MLSKTIMAKLHYISSDTTAVVICFEEIQQWQTCQTDTSTITECNECRDAENRML